MEVPKVTSAINTPLWPDSLLVQVAVSPSNMELPMRQNGEVDWHTLGNILVAHSLGEVVCASYVDNKFGKKQEGLVPATNWKYAYEEKGVVVLVKEIKDSPLKCFMGRSVINLPPKVVHECISVNENALNWDKYAVESSQVECLRHEEDIQDCISYMRHEARQCLVKTKRDFVFYVRNQHIREINKRVMSVISVDHPSSPILPGVDRGELRLGSGWVLEPYEGDASRTLVSYLVHTSLVGLPSLVINRVMRRQPLSIHYLDHYLHKSKQESAKKPSRSSRTKTSSSVDSSLSGEATPDCSMITPDIPTPDIFHDQTGYTFSAVPLGSNPLYNWSITSTVTGNGKISSSDGSERDEDSINASGAKQKLEESESVLDFRITSIDGVGGKRALRPGYLWLPALRSLKMQEQEQEQQGVAPRKREQGVAPRKREDEGTDGSLPSSDCDANCKSQCADAGTGLASRE